jgi:hypothetical protein
MSIFLDGRREGRRVAAKATLPLVLLVGFASCGEDDSSLTGAWSGTFTQEAQQRSGTMRLTLSQSGGALNGRWEAQVPPAPPWVGTFEGTIAGSAVEARFLPDDPEICSYDWTATAGGDRIAGRYEAFDCRVEIVGEIDVRRQ